MKRIAAIALALCLLCGLAGCYTDSAPEGSRRFTFRVIHEDGSRKVYQVTASVAEPLAETLVRHGIVEESNDSAGLYDVVDGERADWDDGMAWWCFRKDGQPLTVGIEDVVPENGAVYEAIFSHGYGDMGV